MVIFYQTTDAGASRTAEREEATIVTSIDSRLDCLVPLAVWKEKVIKIRNDSEIDLDRMKRHLVELGYEWAAQVEVPGQFSIRGESWMYFL